jgi:hypothetical protein
MNIIYSPLSRHILYNYKHYIVFVIHDFSAGLTLFLFIFLWNISKTKIHAFIGKFCLIPLIITISSGFLLIKLKLDNNQKIINLTNEELPIYSLTLFTQGTNIILISVNAFFIKFIIKNKYLVILLVYCHFYDLFYGIKSFLFLSNLIYSSCKRQITDLALELLVILTIPQIINTLYYIYIYYGVNYQLLNININLHHKRSIIFLIYMSLPSILFSITHDKYWFNIYQYLTNIYIRIIFMLVPSFLFIFFTIS